MSYINSQDIAMHNSKVCFRCEIEKPFSDFYKHPKMRDGFFKKMQRVVIK